MWLNVVVGLLVVTIFFLATFVSARKHTAINSTFALFSYLTAIWIVANYVGANYKSHAYAQYFIHADFFFGNLVAISFWYFAATLLEGLKTAKWLANIKANFRLPLTVATALNIIISQLPLTVDIRTLPNHGLSLKYGMGYGLYAVILGGILLFGVVMVGLAYRYATGEYRKQVATISRGLIGGVIIVAAANLALPLITNSADVNLTGGNMAYIGIVAFISSTSYAIVRHRMFDLRFFVVRATAYALSVALISMFYLAPLLWVASHMLHVHISAAGFWFLFFISVPVLIGYKYLRRFFDRATNKVFFRDYYDTQDVLDELSDFLVRTLEVDQVKEGSKRILLGALHVPSLDYWLESHKNKRLFDIFKRIFTSSDTVMLIDDVEPRAAAALREQDIAIVIRLRTTHGNLGYMTLGFKESGQTYTAQDRRLLSTAADEIAITMQNALHFDEIQQFNSTLQGRVDQATRELSKTNDKLKALDETKDEFISMASHQLRTPLTAIKGYLSMVLEGDAGPLNSAQKKMLEQSFASSQRMVYLISDLLNLSRLSTGKFIIERSPVQLADIVEAEVAQLVETARSRDLTLTYHKPATFPIAQLDETKIHQVVMNFLDNAIYYTPAGGHITVSVQETKTAIEYKVADTGIGVPRHEQHRLFSKFYRAGNARQARPDGTGLGLFMAKKAIVAQGGTVIFTSEEGKGSTFGFKFSKRACMIEPAEMAEAPVTAV